MEMKEIKLPFKLRFSSLGMGSQRKNTVAFARGDMVHLSAVHPDLEQLPDLLNFEKAVYGLLKKSPQVIAYDLHPEYQSTKTVLSLPGSFRKTGVQHHHAHIAACMADNGLKNQKVIGVAFDGTGLGADHRLWGGEFLLCDYRNFARRAHLKEIPLLSGEAAIREPGRLAALWLYLAYGEKFTDLRIEFARHLDQRKWQSLKKIYAADFNSPLTSSMGRLFDAAASLVTGKYSAGFEAELAIELERLAGSFGGGSPCAFRVSKNKGMYVLNPLPVFRQIVRGLEKKEAPGMIAFRFHLAIAQMMLDICLRLRQESSLNRVVLSGGVFQNKLLLRLGLELLYKSGFQVFTHRNLPCNDACISVGQAVIAGSGG
jgi:hydrogenase maturation protein HypF